MAVDDLWFASKRGADGQRAKTKRHGRGKRWRVRYTDDAGRPRERLFERRSDADRFDANVRADVSQGRYVDPRAGRVTVTEYAERWRATKLHRDSTAEYVGWAFRLHVEPILGRLAMAAVRPSQMQAWAKDRATVLAPSTLRVVYSHVSSMFAAAALDRVIGASPCVGVRLPEVAREKYFIPTPEQVHALADTFSIEPKLGRPSLARYRALPYVGAGCGLRHGEALGLELEHVNFLGREISVVQQLKVVTGRKPFLAPVKTPTSKRTVELGQVVAQALARHVEEFPPAEVEIDDETDPRRPVRRSARLLFVNGRGEPVHRASWSHVWRPAVAAAGLPAGFGFHGLRHYFATLLIHAGASVTTVQLALGHSKPSITLDVYAGEWPEAVDRTRTLVDAALGRRPAARGLAVAR